MPSVLYSKGLILYNKIKVSLEAQYATHSLTALPFLSI